MNRYRFQWVFAWRCLLLALTVFSSSQLVAQKNTAKQADRKTTRSSNDVPFAMSPATIRVVLNVNPRSIDLATREHISDELGRRLQNAFGQSINLKLQTSFQQYGTPVEREKISSSPDRLNMLNQSLILLYLEPVESSWQIRVRAWFALTDQWIEIPVQTLKNPEAIPRNLARIVSQLIPSVLKVERIEQGRIAGTLAGGEFSTPDDSVNLLRQGEFLGVVMLYFDRERQLKARQILPWTYLKVTGRNRALITCQTISAFRNPIPKSRRRVEVLAYRIHPLYAQTAVRVMVRDAPPRPFRLTRVFLSKWESAPVDEKNSAKNSAKNKEKQSSKVPPVAHLELTTTREGLLFLSRKELEKKFGSGLIKLEVMSDQAVVARVPWLPGSTAELEITVPDDSARIDARLRLEQIETELLRVTAKRATLIAALKQLADNPREIDPSFLFEEIKKLPSRKYFLKQIRLTQVTATDQLIQKGNRTAARDVRKMCEKTEAVVERHLDEEPIDELKLRLGYDEKSTENNKRKTAPD